MSPPSRFGFKIPNEKAENLFCVINEQTDFRTNFHPGLKVLKEQLSFFFRWWQPKIKRLISLKGKVDCKSTRFTKKAEQKFQHFANLIDLVSVYDEHKKEESQALQQSIN